MDEPVEQKRKLGYVESPTVAYLEAKYGVDLHTRQKTHYIWHQDDGAERGEWIKTYCAKCTVDVMQRLAETAEALCPTCYAAFQVRVGMAEQKGFRMGA